MSRGPRGKFVLPREGRRPDIFPAFSGAPPAARNQIHWAVFPKISEGIGVAGNCYDG